MPDQNLVRMTTPPDPLTFDRWTDSGLWFERYRLVCPNGDHDEAWFINHSFTPNVLDFYMFHYALVDIKKGTELTTNYEYIMPEGFEYCVDIVTGKPVIGKHWRVSLLERLKIMQDLMEKKVL